MRVLVLAPHPYYIVRGTPIDLDLVLRVLTSRPETTVDAVVYADGEDRPYPGLTIHRIADTKLTRGFGPGFSLRKLLCDFLLFFKAWSLLRVHRYDLIHAGEETVYMAMLFRRLFGTPFAYDLDSSLAEQMTEKMPGLSFLQGRLNACERSAVREALITFPVCNSLADLCRGYAANRVVTLHDISQLKEPGRRASGRLKRELGTDRLLMLYAGNLEAYQGIDLLLESFARVVRESDAVDLVIVGGSDADIAAYRRKTESLGAAERVHFLGPKPFEELDEYLAEADILTAPRIRGRNTPMKVFPYLHSGKPVLVTDLHTHSQILTPDVAMLAEPTPEGFAAAVLKLAGDEELRRRLGAAGQAFVEASHTFDAHRSRLNGAYDWIEQRLLETSGKA